MNGPTLTIDDPENGGSEDGAWATAIEHTPHLRAQLADDEASPETGEGAPGTGKPRKS